MENLEPAPESDVARLVAAPRIGSYARIDAALPVDGDCPARLFVAGAHTVVRKRDALRDIQSAGLAAYRETQLAAEAEDGDAL